MKKQTKWNILFIVVTLLAICLCMSGVIVEDARMKNLCLNKTGVQSLNILEYANCTQRHKYHRLMEPSDE